jgi:membrane carboxypeptidase/penicillin-binding protein PbpC
MGNATGEGSRSLVGSDAAAPLALRLLAALDGRAHPSPRPMLPPSTPSQPAPRRAIDPILTITSPADHAEFVIDPEANADRQRLPLRAQIAQTSTPTQPLFWFIDGSPLGTSNPDQPLWWNPSTGEHEVRVTNASGRSARATILVR